MARPRCDTPLVLFVCLFVTLRSPKNQMASMHTLLVVLESPECVRGAPRGEDSIMFQLTIEKLLSIEQF
jgi:hypothetical protein